MITLPGSHSGKIKLMNKLPPSTLYIVATPIGNPRDITLRALDILEKADAVICEELREGSKLMKKIGIHQSELVNLNEHNERETAPKLIQRLQQGETFALISDGGTPVFSDPGSYLIRLAAGAGIRVVPVPGPSSLMAALSILDFKLEKFLFAGFLSPKREEREKELEKLKAQHIPIILMDTPYRLMRTLEDVESVFGKARVITLACNLTMNNEKIYRGSVGEIRRLLNNQKAEFILIVHSQQA